MNRKFFWMALAALVLPILVRLIWLFPGFTFPRTIAIPDYANLKMPVAPITTPQVEAIKQQGGIVLVDYAHSNQFLPNEIQTLTDALNQRGAQVDFDSDSTTLASRLKSASAYVVISPSTAFTSEEISLVQDFVGRGGRLSVFTDATRGQIFYDFQGNPVGNTPDVNAANPLVEPFGITFNADYLYNLVENEGNFRNVYFQSFGKSDLTWGLSKVALYGTHSVETDTGLALLVGGDKTLSSATDATPGTDPKKGWAAAVLSKDGNVFAAGDFTFLMPPYNTVGDNSALINNIADFLLSSQRKVILSDFPYIFNGTTVDVLPTSKVQMSAEITGSLSKLQTSLASTNIDLKVVKDAPISGNVIVLGTFSPSDDLTKFVEPFNLKLDDLSEFVEIPQFGKLGRSGNGLLLLNRSEQVTTLVLLADTQDDVTTLLDTLSSGDLTGCLLQEDVGVCSIGFGGSFSVGGTSTPSLGGSMTPEATPIQKETPVTATPGG
jgi:hypothetical protein